MCVSECKAHVSVCVRCVCVYVYASCACKYVREVCVRVCDVLTLQHTCSVTYAATPFKPIVTRTKIGH